MKNKQRRFIDAMDYLNYCAGEGMEVDLSGKSQEDIIKLAEDLMDKADAMYEAQKEQYEI